MLIHGADNLSL